MRCPGKLVALARGEARVRKEDRYEVVVVVVEQVVKNVVVMVSKEETKLESYLMLRYTKIVSRYRAISH